MKGAKLNILDAIGNTPIVKLNKVASGVQSEIYVKLDYLNPGGLSKIGLVLISLSKPSKMGPKAWGYCHRGTSGNTGVGLLCMQQSMAISVSLSLLTNNLKKK